jgi:hypothetical protein
MVFTVSEKLVKERDGAAYDLDKYVLGTDYVVRRAFKGERRMFRKGILDLNDVKTDISPVISEQATKNILERRVFEPKEGAVSIVDPSLVEHKQDKNVILIIPTDLNLPEPNFMTRPANLDGSVRSARVVKKHQNQRWVETDTLGRVFVGEKGNQIKLNQLIQVRDGVLYLPSRT